LGYLPRVLFFNAFELGAVIWEDAHISTGKNLKQERASKSKYETNLNLNHFLWKIVLSRDKSWKHKATSIGRQNKCNFKNFNKKRGTIILLRCIKPCFPLS
jgi:hypothetical protein